MGSNKGQSSQNQNTQTSQTSTYDPRGAGYIQNALGRAAGAANNPFAIPQAPVAGFSQDQQGAFQQFRNAQGAAQPYYNMAANAYSPQGTQDYYNPYAANVMANMKDVFGQQMTQNDSNLTQAAGGVGADRIAVGHAALAKQQDLAAGQTMADLWGRAGTQAMQAGQGFQSLGNNVQNSQLQGTNALLQSGGLQQQLSQAQMNSPYQQQLAMAAFPYQQAQFLAGITGSLAPGLGGTTSGYGSQYGAGTATPAQPSIWSQLLGAGALGVGAYNAFGGSGASDQTAAYGADNINTGNANNPAYGLTAEDYGGWNGQQFRAARGGVINPYAAGGEVEDAIPFSHPIDISKQSIIPQAQLAPIQANVPQIDLRPTPPPQQQQSQQSNPMGDIMKVVQMAAMFARDGGRINPYAVGGRTHYGDEGDPGGAVNDPMIYRMPDRPKGVNPYESWRNDTPLPLASEPPDVPAVSAIKTAAAGVPAETRASAAETLGEGADPLGGQDVSPYSQPAPRRERGFADSPWAALMQAGLGMMAGTSPYAGVNIGQGGMQGLKTLQQQRENAQKDETVNMQARRLSQEAQFHEDAYKRETLAQKNARVRAEEAATYDRATPVKLGTDKNGFDVMGIRDPKNPGKYLDVDGNPLDMSRLGGQPPKAVPGTTGVPEAKADGVLNANASLVDSGPYDYSQDAPYIEKGMELPEPQGVGGKSARSVQTDAEYYLQTGKLPPVKAGKSPVAIAQQSYRNAVQNYGNAMASSRGLSPEQVSEMWRTAPGMMRFVLGADGRATVSLGTAVRHLDTVKQLAEAWAANDTMKVNQLRAILGRQFGSDAATNLDAAGRIVGPEIIKALGVAGAGTAEERHGAGEQFSTARSAAQLAGAVTTTQKLLAGQLDGKMRQARLAGVSEEKFKELIGDRPFQVLREAEGGHPKTTLSPEDRQALDWAKANPNDPRAGDIKKRLGVP